MCVISIAVAQTFLSVSLENVTRTINRDHRKLLIVDRRKAVGEFKSMEQVSRVNGLGDKAYACLGLYAVVEPKAKVGAGKTP